jgi:hypothetical protein
VRRRKMDNKGIKEKGGKEIKVWKFTYDTKRLPFGLPRTFAMFNP